MIVSELRKLLENYPQDAIVLKHAVSSKQGCDNWMTPRDVRDIFTLRGNYLDVNLRSIDLDKS